MALPMQYNTTVVTALEKYVCSQRPSFYSFPHGKCATNVSDLVPPIREFDGEHNLVPMVYIIFNHVYNSKPWDGNSLLVP